MKNIKSIKDIYLNTVWKTPLEGLPLKRKKLISGVRIAHLVIRDLMDGMITLRAMGLVYTTILALVPLLAVSFSVLKGFGVHNQVEPMLLRLFQSLGDKGDELANKIIEFVDNTQAGVLGAMGLALLMYTVVSLLQKIEKAFNYTWRVSDHRPISQRFSDYITVVLIGPVLLFSAFGVTASFSSISMIQDAMEIDSIGILFTFIGRLVPYLLVIAAFTFVYVFVPNTKVKVTSALVGGLVAGVLWETVSWAFTAFVVSSSQYTAIYSAFATLIIFFVWLYVNWLILLVGSSIAFYYQQPAHRHLGERVVRLSNRLRETIALNIMLLIGRHFHTHQPSWSIESLARHMGIPAQVCTKTVKHLVKEKYLLETSHVPATYIPAYDLQALSLLDVLSSVRKSEERTSLSSDDVTIEIEIVELHAEIERAINETLKDKSLRDLAQNKTAG